MKSLKDLFNNFFYKNIKQFLTFGLVGLINTVFGYSLFALCIYLGIPANLALLFAYIFGALFNYITTKKMVFKSSDRKSFLRFIFTYVLMYGLNTSLFNILFSMGINEFLSQALVLPLVVMSSYLLFKFYVFDIHE